MAGYAKGILIVLIVSIVMVVLLNLAYFFPWYITLVETTFEVAQVVANENYLPKDTYDDIYNELKSKPLFNKRQDSILIEADHGGEGGRSAIEESYNNVEDYYDSAYKPYVQRGNTVFVRVSATYPFQMVLGNWTIANADIPMGFWMNTTTLKHYKDLDYYLN